MINPAQNKTLSSRTHRLQNELAALDRELEGLRTEQQAIEQLLCRLQDRLERADDEHRQRLALRDCLEAELWEAQQSPIDLSPTPPDLSAFQASPRTVDPTPESWEFADTDEPLPSWIPPARTWRVPLAVPAGTKARPGRRARSSSATEPVTQARWVSRTDTASFWTLSAANQSD